MKKVLKRVLIGIGIIILLLVLLSVGFFIKFKAETKGMNVIETGNIVDNIFAVKDSFVNMFLIKDNDHYVAIDAGNSLDNVAGELKN